MCTTCAPKPAANDNKVGPAEVFAWFVDQCRKCLHVVLCLYPIGENFRKRLRNYPRLVNCCTIDWFMELVPWQLRGVRAGTRSWTISLRSHLGRRWWDCGRIARTPPSTNRRSGPGAIGVAAAQSCAARGKLMCYMIGSRGTGSGDEDPLEEYFSRAASRRRRRSGDSTTTPAVEVRADPAAGRWARRHLVLRPRRVVQPGE
jgi:hypothetical protein